MLSIKKKSVFISYDRRDKEKARELKDLLEKHDVLVWMDVVRIGGGMIWRSVTRKALRDSDFVVLLLSKNSLTGKGYVRMEFDLALDHHKSLPDKRIYLIPVRADDYEIPPEFDSYHCLEFSDEGLENLIRTLERMDAPVAETQSKSPGKVALAVSILISLAIVTLSVLFSAKDDNKEGFQIVSFKATVFDQQNQAHVEDAIAFILGPGNDTLVKSFPSGPDGQVSFQLDTFENIQATVWYYHPRYKMRSGKYTLMTRLPYRSVRLEPVALQVENREAPVKKLFAVSGISLTRDEKQAILAATGYTADGRSSYKFTVTYDHNAFLQSPVKDKFFFTGSRIIIEGNGSMRETDLNLPPGPSLPLPLRDLEIENSRKLDTLISNNRDKIILTLIECLKD